MFQNLDREMVVVVGLDNSNYPSVIHTVGIGSANQSVVCMASVFKPLLLSNAISFILCHNHPSQDVMKASNADIELTHKIEDIAEDA
jgi:DNA repair protein RadC